jgi:cytochrome c-type biogenesis protein CcmH/NrfF
VTRRGVALVLLALALLSPAAALARPAPRTSLTAVEDEVMCVVCGVPLNVAESPQAERERDLIRQLVAQGRTKDQIKQALVAQYGDQVLALPRRSGFNLAVYLVPLAVVAALAAGLAFAVPRWRRGGRAAAAAAAAAPAAIATPLDAADARRLDEDLARYDR